MEILRANRLNHSRISNNMKTRNLHPNTIISVIEHESHRYETVGDYYVDREGNRIIAVSKMSDPRYELLVAVHELVEMALCQHRGIAENDITAHDMQFELERQNGEHGDKEPGDDPRATYRKEHFFATSIERLLAAELGVDWSTYDKEVVSL